MLDFLEKTILFGLGAISSTKEKIEKTIKELVEKGKLTEIEGKKLVEEMSKKGEEEKEALIKIVQGEVEKAMENVPIATKENVRELEAEVAELKAELAEINKKIKKITRVK